MTVSIPVRQGAQPAAPASTTRLLCLLLPTALALYANFQAAQVIQIPAQIEALDPHRKIGDVALLTMICSVTGILGLTAGGAASDATRSRWGRRAPWLVGMAVVSALLTIGSGLQTGLIGVMAFYGVLWFSLNCFQGAMLAVTPDRVPDDRRNLASSILGVSGPLGALLGVNLAAVALPEAGHVVLAALLLATTAMFVVFAREEAWPAPGAKPVRGEDDLPGRRWRMTWGLLQSFSSRDFSLAYALRGLMFTAQFSINNYLLYILQDHIGVANLPSGNAQIAAGALNTLRTCATLAAIFLGYGIAHRNERRKIFVQGYAVGMAVAMIVPVISPTWTGLLIFSGLGGLAMGAYSVVDLTLMSRVLPSKDSAGRDLALLVMAGASAQFVAPLAGGALIRLLGYNALFVFAALVTLGAGAVTFFIRGVR